MRFLSVAAVLLGLAAPARAADSLRCNGALVSLGASKVDLLGKCGEPARQESREETRSTFTTDPTQQVTSEKRVTLTVERWTYDFGSGDFVRTVTLENGKIVSIAEGGYGSAAGRAGAGSKVQITRCDPLRDLAPGESSDQLLSRCGEPASREYKQVDLLDTVQEPNGATSGTATTVQIEVWSYNFGPDSFIRLVHIRDGKVTKVVTGGYGFGG